MLLELAAILVGYLLGSFPSAYIITRIRKGIDIRDVDIGNVGAGSVLRQVGLWEGIVVIIVDMAKGGVAIFVAQALGVSQLWVLGAGFAAVLGHSFPIYIGFRGGQGIATIMGVFFVLTPVAMIINTVLIGVPLLITRRLFVSLYLIVPLYPLFIWIFDGSMVLVIYSLVILLYIGVRNMHRVKEVQAVFIKNK